MNYSNFFIKLYLFFMLVGGLNAVGMRTRTRIAYINKADNTIRYYDGEVSSANCSNLKWIDITGGLPAKDIAIASDGQMLAIGENNGLYYSSGVVNGVANWIRQGSFEWVKSIAAAGNNKFLYVGRGAADFAHGGDAAFGHDDDYNALHYCFTAPGNDGQLAWKSFKDRTIAGPIAINSKGQFMHASGLIFYQSGKIGPNGEVSGTSDDWQAHPGTDAQSVAAANGLFMHSTPNRMMYYIKADNLDGKSASDWVHLTSGRTLKIAVSDSGQLISMGSGQLFYADKIDDDSTADWVALLNNGVNISAISVAISSTSIPSTENTDGISKDDPGISKDDPGISKDDPGISNTAAMATLRTALATYFGAPSTIATLADITAAQITAKIAANTFAVVNNYVNSQIGTLTSSEITTFKARIIDPGSGRGRGRKGGRGRVDTNVVGTNVGGTNVGVTGAEAGTGKGLGGRPARPTRTAGGARPRGAVR